MSTEPEEMMWIYCFLSLLISLDAMDFATAKDPCKTEVSVLGMALKGFVYKKVTVTAPYECDFTCRGERKCQSLNYVIGEKSCELSARTKEATPENFQSDDLRFYMGRFVGRSKHQNVIHYTSRFSSLIPCENPQLSKRKSV